MKQSIGLFVICISLMLAAVCLPSQFFLWNHSSGHWAEEEMNQLQQMCIPVPFSRKQWEQPIARGDLCTLLVSAFASDDFENVPAFSDVPPEHRCFSAIHTALRNGWIEQAEFFRPDDPLTRLELLLICSHLMPLSPADNLEKIASDVPEDRQALVSAAVQSGLFNLYEDHTFRPSEPVKNVEAASVICRILKAGQNGDGIRRAMLLDYLQAFAENREVSDFCTSPEKERQQYRNEFVLPFFHDKKIKKSIKDLELRLTKEGGTAHFTLCFPDREIKSEFQFTTQQTDGTYLLSDAYLRFLSPEPIRMVWEYASRPDMEYTNQNKATVVSPTWFKLIDEKETEVFQKDSEITETLFLSDYSGQSFIKEANKRKQQIWGLCSNGFHPDRTRQVLTDPTSRQTLIETLITKSIDCGLDGINLDFENMYREDAEIFSDFVQQCSMYTKECGLILSIDVTKIEETSDFYSMCYDRQTLSRYADYLILMAYDQHPRSSDTAGPIAALDWTEEAVSGILEQVPSHKLLLGIPFYTRIWETKDGTVTDAPAASMQEITELLTDKNITTTWNEQEKLHYAEYEKDGKQYQIWLEDGDSCSARLDLIDRYHLPGIACWSGGYENSQIWDIIEEKLK